MLCHECTMRGSAALLAAIDRQRSLGELGGPTSAPRLTVRGLMAHVAAIAGIGVAEVEGPNRRRAMVDLRRAVVWVARETTGLSYPAIARLMAGRDHSTMINLHRTASARIARDPKFALLVERLWTAAEHEPFGPGGKPGAGDAEALDELRAALRLAAPPPPPPPADDEDDDEDRRRPAMVACSTALIAALHRSHPERVPVLPRMAEAARSVRAGYCREVVA